MKEGVYNFWFRPAFEFRSTIWSCSQKQLIVKYQLGVDEINTITIITDARTYF